MIFGGKDQKSKTPSKKGPKAPFEIETMLGPNTSFQGDIRSSGGVRIDGDFGGTIEIAGNLIVGENATVVAEIAAHNVQVQGTVQGCVTAKRLEILDTGKLWGDIVVDSFVLDDGGFYRGRSQMEGDTPPALLEAPQPSSSEVVDAEAVDIVDDVQD
jgi:cytoskeletal protein CcmA (bactofilin family)